MTASKSFGGSRPQTCSRTPRTGVCIPARNWVWEHSIVEGHARHWILDDNIRSFRRWYHNERLQVTDGMTFVAAESFVDRYSNVALAGMNYTFLANTSLTNVIQKPFLLNSRIYSCILIKNDIPFRWRGRYNEDTDLSLRCLKAGWCTVLFYAFLCDKQATLSMKGGNTDELYRQDDEFDGRWEMAESLRRQHPDVTKVTRKWGRWQHQVNYKPFAANALQRRTDINWDELPPVDEFGMKLRQVAPIKSGRIQRFMEQYAEPT